MIDEWMSLLFVSVLGEKQIKEDKMGRPCGTHVREMNSSLIEH
jgi:hypothetical protein